jgi:hypothetical protein
VEAVLAGADGPATFSLEKEGKAVKKRVNPSPFGVARTESGLANYLSL